MSAVVPAPSLVVDLSSIVVRLDLARLFPKKQLLEVELGSGDASFIAEYAKLHPERNFIGVERLLGRMRKLDRKGHRAGLQNLRGVRIECAYFLEFLLPSHSASVLHVYFPDPWPNGTAKTGSSTSVFPAWHIPLWHPAVWFICARMT